MKNQDDRPQANAVERVRQVVLHTAPGGGLLSRRSRALLFVPDATDADKILSGFEAADAGREFEALAELALEAELDLPPFAAVDFGPVVTLRLFGDLELETDQPSAPRLSAASCGTWVDHAIHRPARNVTIRVAAEGCNPLTNAQLGCFSAGGFELRLESRDERQPIEATPSRQNAERPTERPNELGDPSPDDESSGSLVKLVLDGLLTTDVRHEGPGEPSEPPEKKRDEVPTVEPPDAIAALGPDRDPGRARAVLRFDDGRRVEVRQPMVIGRNPVRMAETADLEPLIIAGGKVSRAHLMVSIEDGQVLVDDCGSRNGSAILSNGAAEPMQLLSGSPVAVDVGTKVYLGSRSFTVLETNLEGAR